VVRQPLTVIADAILYTAAAAILHHQVLLQISIPLEMDVVDQLTEALDAQHLNAALNSELTLPNISTLAK
jgi:hypothetical protein